MEELVKKDILQVESGLITVSDESEILGWENLEDSTLLKYLQEGKAFTFATHADGNFEIKTILLTKRSDVYKLMEEGYDFIFKTEWAVVSIKTGNLLIADPSAYTNKDDSLKPVRISVASGSYWIQSALVKTDKNFYGVIVFIIPTEPLNIPDSFIKAANKDIKEIGEFD